MATPLLITRTDFAGRVELSANMTDAKINPRILEAEDFDLRGLMGDAFYWDWVNNNSTPDNQTLLNGGDYIINDITYNFYGIKPVLVYYATSRIIKDLDVHFTPNGMMQKRNDFSDHMDSKDLSWRAKQFINQGLAYWEMCIKYLDANKDLYPLWNMGCCDDKSNPKPETRVTALGGQSYDDIYTIPIIRRF